jgi:hypothetical protein
MKLTGRTREEVLEAKTVLANGIRSQYLNKILFEPAKAELFRTEMQFILKVRGLQ